MGHRAIHPNLCLASRNTYSRSTLGDLEKITEQLEWWAPPTFFLLAETRLVRPNASPSVLHTASSITFALFTGRSERTDANKDVQAISMLRLAATTARRTAKTRFLASAKHAAKPRREVTFRCSRLGCMLGRGQKPGGTLRSDAPRVHGCETKHSY